MIISVIEPMKSEMSPSIGTAPGDGLLISLHGRLKLAGSILGDVARLIFGRADFALCLPDGLLGLAFSLQTDAPVTVPAASLMAPLTCLPAPSTRSLSMRTLLLVGGYQRVITDKVA